MSILLAIDDDPMILAAYRRIFPEPAYTLRLATSAAAGLEQLAEQRPDAVLLDIILPDLSGLEACRRIQQYDARIPIIFVTGHGTTERAIEAMKLGAYDYLLKDHLFEPAQTARLRQLVGRAVEVSRLMRDPALPKDADRVPTSTDVLIGHCPAMQEVYKAIGRVAPQDVTVLILGESGTGKELVARAIYQHSRRASGPFLPINCAAIPETLLESELFGHEKGAFTGADRRRIGKFEQCSGGTLFLDEIGDMTPLTQTKILRVLQEQRFERVGGNETIQTNVRLIAATNRNLERLVALGQFRSDLYYRLSVFTISLPPLRERGDDLPLLVEHFVQRFQPELGKDVFQVAPETMALLQRHSWPGNLRELQSVLKQAMLQAAGPVLLPEFLPAYLRQPDKPLPEPTASPTASWDQFIDDRLHFGTTDLYAEWLALTERHLLLRVLRFTQGNQVQAARLLGIARNSLRSKIRSLGINMERWVWSDAAPAAPPKQPAS
ncbi:MAG: sigma-54 dependent transcriptional regulator [Gemmataceae bacterium]|nr:sigma-54 dependent transcriptional regulator [Gemmataceae bacterium]MDW8265763.1 sigma-54 dependent transcriptional regulator [Gemmataceae bacterium]